jgi:hypothetical protein
VDMAAVRVGAEGLGGHARPPSADHGGGRRSFVDLPPALFPIDVMSLISLLPANRCCGREVVLPAGFRSSGVFG